MSIFICIPSLNLYNSSWYFCSYYTDQETEGQSREWLASYSLVLAESVQIQISDFKRIAHSVPSKVSSLDIPFPLCPQGCRVCALRFLATELRGKPQLPRWPSGRESACNAGGVSSIPGTEDPLEKEIVTLSSILAWEVPWREEPDRLQSGGLQSLTQLSD